MPWKKVGVLRRDVHAYARIIEAHMKVCVHTHAHIHNYTCTHS